MDRLQVENPLYPLVCIASAFILLVVGLLYAKHSCFALYILCVCLLYCAFGLWKATVQCIVIFIPVSLVFALFSLLFQRDGVVALQMAGRVVLIGVSALPMVTLAPVHLTRCLAKMGVPRVMTLGMLIAIRFVPVIGDELRRVREAMRTRGVRASFYRAFIIPVMIRLLNISDTMALSLETRGFSSEDVPVSAYKSVCFTMRDGLYCALSMGFLAGWAVLV